MRILYVGAMVVFACSHNLTAVSKTTAQVLTFGLEDFAELGRIPIQGTFKNLSIANQGLNATINYSDVLVGSLVSFASVGDTLPAELISFADDALTVADLPSPRSIAEAGADFSWLDLGEARSAITTLNAELSVLSSQLTPLPLPNNQWFVAGVISGRARQEMIAVQERAKQSRTQLQERSLEVLSTLGYFDALESNALTAQRGVNAMSGRLIELLSEPGPALHGRF
jgi:hypothetical protein